MVSGGISFHMECPGCSEEIHREELIDGECPLCGEPVQGGGDEHAGAISEIVEFFDEQPETMAVNVQQRPAESRELVLHETPTLLDHLRPKRCDVCGRWHLAVGDKRVEVTLEGDEGRLERQFLCQLCETPE